MQLSLYDVSIPVLVAGLRNTASFLGRDRAHADLAGSIMPPRWVPAWLPT